MALSEEIRVVKKELADTKKRLQVLEDIEAIKKLKAYYNQACDNGYDVKMMKEIFTEDAVWDGGKELGLHKGKKAVLEFMEQVGKGFIFAVHYFVVPDITVDGDKAWGHWYMWMAATLAGNKAVWLAGYEDDKYIKTDGRWWQNYMKLTLLFQTPYEEGWHKKKRM